MPLPPVFPLGPSCMRLPQALQGPGPPAQFMAFLLAHLTFHVAAAVNLRGQHARVHGCAAPFCVPLSWAYSKLAAPADGMQHKFTVHGMQAEATCLPGCRRELAVTTGLGQRGVASARTRERCCHDSVGLPLQTP